MRLSHHSKALFLSLSLSLFWFQRRILSNVLQPLNIKKLFWIFNFWKFGSFWWSPNHTSGGREMWKNYGNWKIIIKKIREGEKLGGEGASVPWVFVEECRTGLAKSVKPCLLPTANAHFSFIFISVSFYSILCFSLENPNTWILMKKHRSNKLAPFVFCF